MAKQKTAKEMYQKGIVLILSSFMIKEQKSLDSRDYKSAELMLEKRREFTDLMKENYHQFFQEDGK